MNHSRYPIINYVPYNPDNYLTGGNLEHSLGDTLDRQKYQKILNNPNYHFANSYITNFDIINHECKGDKLENSKKYYETIFKETVDKEIQENEKKKRILYLKRLIVREKTLFLKKMY